MSGVFQVHSVVEEMDGLDDVENSMLYYNQAVILYHLRQYTEAISVGEKLYQFIEPFGMQAKRRILFIQELQKDNSFFFTVRQVISTSFNTVLRNQVGFCNEEYVLLTSRRTDEFERRCFRELQQTGALKLKWIFFNLRRYLYK